MMKKLIPVFSMLLAGVGITSAQDQPHYAFYNLQQSIINPAAMGTFDEVYAGAIFNTQMTGFNGAPYYGLLDVGIPIAKTNAYIGVQMQHDRIGPSNRTMFGGSFAYRLKLDLQHFLCFGLSASAEMFNANLASVPVQDPNDPVFSQNIAGVWSPNFKLGVYYFSDNVYAGFNIGNVLVNKLRYDTPGGSSAIRLDPSAMHFYLQAGWQKKFARVWKFQPSLLVKYVHGSPLQIDINAQFQFKEMIGLGVSYRTLSNILVQVNYTWNKRLILGYAANFGLKFNERAAFSGHEIFLALRFKSNRKMLPIDVPRF